MGPEEIENRLIRLLKDEPGREEAIRTCALFVLRNRGTWEDAREIFSEALFSVLSTAKKKEVTIKQSLPAYLYGVCRNLWIARLRRRGDTRPITNGKEEEIVLPDGGTEAGEERQREEIRLRSLSECLNRLSDRCRKILEAYYWDNQSFREISGALNLTESNARKIAERCRKKLKQCIQKKSAVVDREYNQEDIERYIRNEMSAEEQKVFTEKMKADPGLAEEVAFQKQLSETLKFKKLVDSALDRFEEKGLHRDLLGEKRTAGVFRLRSMPAIAAGIAVLIVCGGLLWANLHYSDAALAGLDYGKLEYDLDTRSREAGRTGVAEEASRAIRQGDYEKALDLLGGMSPADSGYYVSRIDLGFIQFARKNYEAAIRNAGIVLAEENVPPMFRDRAEWLKTKALLASGEETAARNLLNEIQSDSAHVFHEEAGQLNRSLGSIWRIFVF